MDRLASIAAQLVAARRSGQAFVAAPEDGPANVDDAHRIQALVAQELFPGARARAWKVGAPRRDVEPTAAPIHPPLVLESPATWTRSPVTGFAIEAEVAFEVAHDIGPAELGALDISRAFERLRVTIEICDARISNHREVSSLWKLADSQVNAGLVLGSGCAVSNIADYAQLRCEVRVDGRGVFDAAGRHPLGDPRVLLPWWVAHAARRAPLRAGDIVTTGSWCGLLPVTGGSTVVAHFEGIGDASIRFAF